MNEERVQEIQAKTMKTKTEQELTSIINASANKWEPEAIGAAKRELEERKTFSELQKEVDISELSNDEIIREQLKELRELRKAIDKISLPAITNELKYQSTKLKNISSAATLFIVLTIISIIVSFCSFSY
ncbi:MAG TPA: hypothetical protein ENG59_08905 [Chloroflexi bacterium]|nr:MAG: hypothetical protein DRI46_07655 [Chloroflexota bacterium]HDD56345.1 hypothetical protein [Chloroflexota bacterium]